MYLNVIKAVYDKSIANIILNGEKAESFSSKIRNKTKMPTLTTFIQRIKQSPSQGNLARKEKARKKASKLERKK